MCKTNLVNHMKKRYTCACSKDGSYCDEEVWMDASYAHMQREMSNMLYMCGPQGLDPAYTYRGSVYPQPPSRPSWVSDNPYSNLAEALYRAPAAERNRVFDWMERPAPAPHPVVDPVPPSRPGVIEGIYGYAHPIRDRG